MSWTGPDVSRCNLNLCSLVRMRQDKKTLPLCWAVKVCQNYWKTLLLSSRSYSQGCQSWNNQKNRVNEPLTNSTKLKISAILKYQVFSVGSPFLVVYMWEKSIRGWKFFGSVCGWWTWTEGKTWRGDMKQTLWITSSVYSNLSCGWVGEGRLQ